MGIAGLRCFRDTFWYCTNPELKDKVNKFSEEHPDSVLNLMVFEQAGIKCESIVCELETDNFKLCKFVKSETMDLSDFHTSGEVKFTRVKPDGTTEEKGSGKGKKGKKSSQDLTEPPKQGVFW